MSFLDFLNSLSGDNMNKSTGKKLLETFLDGKSKPTVVPSEVTVTVGKRPVFHGPQETVPVPSNMADLKRDERGYLVPYFVSWIDGKPEFRCVAPGAVNRCIRDRLCWICGKPHDNGCPPSYVIGPMCMLNRISSEPGSHIECARYATRVCPFLLSPRMSRNEKDMPESKCDPGGIFIKRNPGAIVIWTTDKFNLVPSGDSLLFLLGDPTHIEFWREGRSATRAEVVESIRTGVPILIKEAQSKGPEAMQQLDQMMTESFKLLVKYT